MDISINQTQNIVCKPVITNMATKIKYKIIYEIINVACLKTAWSRVRLETLTVAQLSTNSLHFMEPKEHEPDTDPCPEARRRNPHSP